MSRGNCKSLGNLREGERSRATCGGQLLMCALPGRRFQQIMHYHMQHEQYRQVLAVCERHGEQEPSLWEQALSYFARKEEDCKQYVAAVLKHIEGKNLMPPLLGTPEDRAGGWVQAASSRALGQGPFRSIQRAASFMVLFPPGPPSQWCRPWPTTPRPPCLSSGTT